MSKSFIKVLNTWREIQRPLVKDNGIWRAIKKIWVKDNGTWRQVFGNTGTVSFTTPGNFFFVIPAGVYSITTTGCGGGGGGGRGDGGRNNEGPGFGGGATNLTTVSNIPVTPGSALGVTVGAGGLQGGSNTNGFDGGLTLLTLDFNINNILFSAPGAGGGTANNSGFGSGGIGVAGGNNGGNPNGGLSTNGGANGGDGGPYNRNYVGFGTPGQPGKLTISF